MSWPIDTHAKRKNDLQVTKPGGSRINSPFPPRQNEDYQRDNEEHKEQQS